MQVPYKGDALFDGDNAPVEGHGVLVEDDKVASVAPEAAFEGFSGTVIDTSGGTLMPGLIDCHVHLCLGAEGDPGTAAKKLLPGQTVMKALDRAQTTFAGGKIAMGTDAGTPFNKHGANSDELALMVGIGIAPLDELRISTSSAADLVDLPGEGRITEGGFADFLLVDGNPAEDIDRAAKREHHRLVVKRGQPVSAATMALAAAPFQPLAAF